MKPLGRDGPELLGIEKALALHPRAVEDFV